MLTDADFDFAIGIVDDDRYGGFFDSPAEWMQTHFYIPETNGTIELYPQQTLPLNEYLRRDEKGLFVYSTVLWGAIKKSAKSTISAAVALGFAWSRPNARIKMLGNDLKQAQSRAYEYAKRAILLHPEWREMCKILRNTITFPNGSVIEALAVDPQGEAGGNDDLVIITEAWGWMNSKHEMMWTEMTLSPTKYGQSLTWVESYAGFTGQSTVLEGLYNQGVVQGDVLNAEYEMYHNREARLGALWVTQPRLPFQTPEYYAQEQARLTDSEFNRVHRNQWSDSSNPFVPYDWWDECAIDVVPEAKRVSVALDASVSGDCFAIVAVSAEYQRDDAGVEHKIVYVQDVHVIYPPKNGKIDYDEVRALLKQWRNRWKIAKIVYDPYQLHDFATQGQKQLKIVFEEFKQGAPRLIADKTLYDMIKNGRIRHANDRVLNEHIKNSARQEQGDSKLRIIKKHDSSKIDAVVALSMACEASIPFRAMFG